MTSNVEFSAMAVQSSFGRDGAMFENLLAFVAQLSVAQWGLVILTAVIRSVGIRIYRQVAVRRAIAATTAVPLAAVPLDAPPDLHGRPVSAVHAAALPTDSVEA